MTRRPRRASCAPRSRRARLAQSRKRKKARRRAGEARRPAPVAAAEPSNGDSVQPPAAAEARGYARSRAKNDAARAALKPLARGERPTAVTVGAIAAVVLALV